MELDSLLLYLEHLLMPSEIVAESDVGNCERFPLFLAIVVLLVPGQTQKRFLEYLIFPVGDVVQAGFFCLGNFLIYFRRKHLHRRRLTLNVVFFFFLFWNLVVE